MSWYPWRRYWDGRRFRWMHAPKEQAPRPPWDIKPTGRHGSRVQRRRARGKR